jgi:hypothetical protein
MALASAAFLADVAFFALVLTAIPVVLISLAFRKGPSHH